MKQLVDRWVTLGQRLEALTPTAPVVVAACRENPWFMPDEVVGAAHAFARQMLRRKALEERLLDYPQLPATRPRRVGIIMAGNIPLVGLFDLLCVLITGHRAIVKPSSKDRLLMEWVVEQLRAIDPTTPVEWFQKEGPAPEAVIATGSDNALRAFRASYAGMATLLRGSRQSVALLDGSESEAELQGLQQDIFAYSGLGCRNVSLLFLPEGLEPEITPPAMNPLYAQNYRYRRALRQLTGLPGRDLGGALLVEGRGFSSALSELTVYRYHHLGEVEEWLREHDSEVQCVVGRAIDHPRRVDFGQAQSPTLRDYPDAVDVLAFLSEL